MSRMLPRFPSVNELLESPPLKTLVNRVNPSAVIAGVRRFLDDMRTQVQSVATTVHIPAPSELAQRIADWISAGQPSPILHVINATGSVINSQLGGVPLADEAVQAIAATTHGYASLEIDLVTGERCDPGREVETLLARLTGADSALVVNSHAAANWIIFAALARDREVIISRGQMPDREFRLDELTTSAGAMLREVGTTNHTRLDDYAAAIGQKTAALLRVHASTYSIVGRHEEAPLIALVELAKTKGLSVIDDLGSTALVDLARYGLVAEPLPSDSIRTGADVVLFRGDDFVGGPPCGIIIGRRELIRKVKVCPLMPVLRAEKLTLSALAATLRLYQSVEVAERSIPFLSLVATPLANLRQRAERLTPQVSAMGIGAVEIVAGQASISAAGSPSQSLPTICIAIAPSGRSADQLASALRLGSPPVFVRLESGKLLLDLRSVQPRDDLQLIAALDTLRTPSDASATSVSAPVAP